MRPVERGPRGDAEPMPAAPAIELTRACGQPANELAGAAETAHPIRPAGGLEPGSALGLGAEPVQQTWQRPVVHDYNLPDSASAPESSAARQQFRWILFASLAFRHQLAQPCEQPGVANHELRLRTVAWHGQIGSMPLGERRNAHFGLAELHAENRGRRGLEPESLEPLDGVRDDDQQAAARDGLFP